MWEKKARGKLCLEEQINPTISVSCIEKMNLERILRFGEQKRDGFVKNKIWRSHELKQNNTLWKILNEKVWKVDVYFWKGQISGGRTDRRRVHGVWSYFQLNLQVWKKHSP